MSTTVTPLAGRILLAAIFFLSGTAKLGAYAATQQYMEAMGVPGALLPLVIAAEVGGGLALIAGLFTRTAAAGLAVFTVAAAVLFHGNGADQNESIHFLKNLAIAGGLLMLVAHGPGALSIDGWRARGRATAAGVA